MNGSRLDAPLVRPGISTFPMKHQILTMRLSLQPVFRFCRQIYTQPANIYVNSTNNIYILLHLSLDCYPSIIIKHVY